MSVWSAVYIPHTEWKLIWNLINLHATHATKQDSQNMVSYIYIPAASVAGGDTAAAAARTMTMAAAAAERGQQMGHTVAAVAAAPSAAASAGPQLMPLRNCSGPPARPPFQRPHPQWR